MPNPSFEARPNGKPPGQPQLERYAVRTKVGSRTIDMDTVLLTTGLACVIAAIVGGGLKAFGMELPILRSLPRQVLLGAVGIALIGGVFLFIQ